MNTFDYWQRKNNRINNKLMTGSPSKDPLHGKTLASILQQLVNKYGWDELGNLIHINCFQNNPTINSSLKFLRKTEWARKKVEDLYIQSLADDSH